MTLNAIELIEKVDTVFKVKSMIHQSTQCVFGNNLELVVNINKTVNVCGQHKQDC